jgi:hypothetical protein
MRNNDNRHQKINLLLDNDCHFDRADNQVGDVNRTDKQFTNLILSSVNEGAESLIDVSSGRTPPRRMSTNLCVVPELLSGTCAL